MSADLWAWLDVRGYEIARFLLSLLWQSSILLLGMAAVGYLLRRQPARVRHVLWLVGLLCMPLLPLMSWAGSRAGTPQRQVAVIPQYREQFARAAAPAAPAPSFQSLPVMPSEAPPWVSQVPAQSVERESPIPAPPMPLPAVAPAPAHPAQRARIYPWAYGIAAYAAVTAALLAWVLFGWLQMRRRLLRARVLNDARVTGILSSAQEQAGVSRCVAVIESEAHAAPLTFGTFLPVIIVPRGLLAGLSDEEIRVLLLHELAHIRRRDAPTLMLVSLLRALFFFQPLAWVAARRVSILSERAADDIVLEVTEQPMAYAKTLARLAEELPRRAIGIELSAGFVFSRGAFLGRVKAVLAARVRDRKLSRWALLRTVAAVVIALCIACAVPMAEKPASEVAKSPAPTGTAPEKPKSPQPLPAACAVAVDILTNHFIRDAVMLVPNGTWHSAPALADIAGNGTLQVIAPVGERWVGAWYCDGRPVPGWPQECGRICCPVAVGDVFHDGKLEIASPGRLWRADGQLVPGWPQGTPNCFCAPSLADLEGDGRLEILESDIQSGVCVRRGDGTMMPGWPIAVPDNDVRSTPLAFDLLGDGKKEIVFTRREGEVRIYTLDGKPFQDYPKRFRGGWQQNFALTEKGELVTGGTIIDLINGTVADLPGERGGEAPCLVKDSATGQLTNFAPAGNSFYPDSAVAADIAGDGNVVSLSGARDGAYHAIRRDGTEASGWPKQLTPAGDSGMAVGNLFGDTLQVVINADGGRMYVFDEAAPATTPIPWPTFLANNLRNGMPGHPETPHATAAIPAAGEKALALRKALSQGNWDAAISIYQEALATVQQNAARFEASEAARMEQAGLLSIARVLNTRAKRFDEAAAFYRQAIKAAPDTWPACQALIECMDLARFHPDLTQAKAAFAGAIDAYLPALKAAGEETDVRRYAAAQACAQADRSEGTALFEALAQEATPFVASMAQSFMDYDGLPFLLNLTESQRHTVEVKTRDLTPENKAEAKVEVLLETDPNSPTREDFPMTLRLKAPADEAAELGAGWQAEADGQLQREVERKLASAPLGQLRGSRELLSSWSESLDSVTVRREVTRVDDSHMHFKVFFQESALKQLEFGFMTYGTGAKIDPSSVSPSGAIFNNEGEVRFNSMGAERNGMSLADGMTVEANIELPAGTKFFYPQVQVRAWGDKEEMQVEPRTGTQSVRGQAEEITYDLSSPRRFKVISADKDDIYWSIILAKLDANDVAQASPAASVPPANVNNVSQPREVNLRSGSDTDLAALKDVQQITTLDLSDSDVTDAGLARLEEMTGLKQLDLNRCANITDAGLTHLKPLKNLRRLSLFGDHITDAGLANLKDLVDLETLQLFGSDQITDQGLANIAAMKHLKDLNLSGSQITDSGLTSLDDLKLQGIWLDDCNGITDAGMPCLAKMTSLRRLGLDRTQLTDAGLKQLSSLKDLDTLSLDGTQITDAGLAALKDMRHMSVLGLWSCKRITDAGLANLQGMNSLITVYLDDTNVTDAGLENLKGLHRLAYLGLGQTQIGDAGIANLKDLDTLVMLRIENTRVTDAGLTNLKGMRRLRSLGLSNCAGITGAAVGYLKEMKSLQQIALYGISISDGALADLKAALPKAQIFVTPKTQDQAPSDQSEQTNPARVQPAQGTTVTLRNGTDADLATLKDVQQITRLDLSDSSVTDAGLARLKEMTGLRDLYLNNCTNITDAGLINLKDCKNLTALSIGNTRITEAGLALLKEMKGLQVLDLRFIKITPAGLAQVKEMKSLTNLVLQGTGMTDAGLAELKDMKTLDYLDLGSTKVTDAGLAQLKEMNGLTSLDLGGTPVTDAGLAQLKEIQGLKWLDLSWTRVTDVGLMNLKEMKGLQSLDLSCTNVTDAGIGLLKEMKGLEALWLRKTKLTDVGLANLEEMNGIQTLDLSDTRVTDAGLTNLKGMNWLRSLGLSNCTGITDGAVAYLKEMKSLEEIDLRGIPISDGALADLKAALPKAQILVTAKTQNQAPPVQPGQTNPARVQPARGTTVNLRNGTDADLAALKDVQQITRLDLSDSNVTDAGLARLEEMAGLQDLYLTRCLVTDAGVAHLKPLKNLRWLSLIETHVTDAGLTELTGLPALMSLDLSGTKVTDAGLVCLVKLKELRWLTLNDCRGITDEGLAVLPEMKQLANVGLSDCLGITDAGAAHLKDVTNLLSVGLSGMKITDRTLEILAGKDLGSLSLRDTGVSDAGLACLKDMPHLQILDLSGCSITGDGLANLKGLNNLMNLELSGCRQLKDSAVTCLKELKQLRELGLRQTSLSTAELADIRKALANTRVMADQTWQGTEPSPQAQGSEVRLEDATDADLAALKNPDRITSLIISSQKVTDAGLSCLEKMPNLQQAWLYCNNLTDATLAHIAGIHKLNFLNIAATHITDEGLSDLKGLTQLRHLDLLWGCSQITDSGLSALKGLTQLQDLNLQGCSRITDAGVACVAGMPELNSIGLSGSQVTDAGLAKFEGRTNLTWLDLSNTGIGDAGLANLKGLTAMYGLTLDRCYGITDAGLANLKGMRKLGWLSLSQCPKITDAGLANLSEMSELESLDLRGCTQITDAGLECLKNLKHLRGRLDLSGTKVTAAGIARVKAALPQAQIVSRELPPQPPPQPQAPAAVTKALAAEWPSVDFRVVGVGQAPNHPGWEPKKLWRAVAVQEGGNTVVGVTDSGVVERVAYFSGSLPKEIEDAAASAIPGAKFNGGSRIELRTDRTGAGLPKPDVTYQLQVVGSDAAAGLSISADGKSVKTIWKTPPAAFNAARNEFPEGLLMVQPERILSKSGLRTPGWRFTCRTSSNKWALVTDAGEVVKVVTQYPYRSGALPKGVPAAVAAALTDRNNPFGFISKVEDYFDENMTRLAHPIVKYEFNGAGAQRTTLTEDGAMIEQIKAVPQPPKAIAEAAAAACPGATISQTQSRETRLDEKMVPLEKPKVTYTVTLQAPHAESSIFAVTLNETGAVTELETLTTKPDNLPKPVADAVAAAVPGGTITSVAKTERRLEPKREKLPNPSYYVNVSDGDRTVTLIMGEDGKVAVQYAMPNWNLFGW
jgi:Leucine-rich repeat (LRR) protein/beta-lactamase regulating signal transducer with metallopeptidase domain/tetratricopeptide (TPR) repeat protein